MSRQWIEINSYERFLVTGQRSNQLNYVPNRGINNLAYRLLHKSWNNRYRRNTPVPRPSGSADLWEDRRKRALALLDLGLSLNEVGRRIRSSASSVMRWRDARRRGGAKALKVRFSPGRPWKLGKKQRRRF